MCSPTRRKRARGEEVVMATSIAQAPILGATGADPLPGLVPKSRPMGPVGAFLFSEHWRIFLILWGSRRVELQKKVGAAMSDAAVLCFHAARCPALYRSAAIALQAGADDFFVSSHHVGRWSQKERRVFACWIFVRLVLFVLLV